MLTVSLFSGICSCSAEDFGAGSVELESKKGNLRLTWTFEEVYKWVSLHTKSFLIIHVHQQKSLLVPLSFFLSFFQKFFIFLKMLLKLRHEQHDINFCDGGEEDDDDCCDESQHEWLLYYFVHSFSHAISKGEAEHRLNRLIYRAEWSCVLIHRHSEGDEGEKHHNGSEGKCHYLIS